MQLLSYFKLSLGIKIYGNFRMGVPVDSCKLQSHFRVGVPVNCRIFGWVSL